MSNAPTTTACSAEKDEEEEEDSGKDMLGRRERRGRGSLVELGGFTTQPLEV